MIGVDTRSWSEGQSALLSSGHEDGMSLHDLNSLVEPHVSTVLPQRWAVVCLSVFLSTIYKFILLRPEDTFIERWNRWWQRQKLSVSKFFKDYRRRWPYYEGNSSVCSNDPQLNKLGTKSPPTDRCHLPNREFTLSAYAETGQAESTIPVLKQQSYTGNKPAISSALADIRCADLGIDGVLEKLNATLGTSYTLGSKILHFLGIVQLRSILEPYVARNDDFGTVYAHLRPYWYRYKVASMKHELRIREEEDREMRKKVLIDGRITKRDVPPRLVWDLYANRVVPYWVVPFLSADERPSAISHAWVDEKDRVDVMTPINGHEWPVPMPKEANLDLIRIEMLNLRVEYAWLDVLCLRQEGGKNEHLRLEEWKLDVPTIGSVYEKAKRVVCYFNGLGRPLHLTPGYFESDRCWFRRAWTLQEITPDLIIAGKTRNDVMEQDVQRRFDEQLFSLRLIRHTYVSINIFDILSQMQNRVSTKPLDRVAGLAYLLKLDFIPIYEAKQSPEDAWGTLVDAMKPGNRTELLRYYPEPGNGKERWRPSWQQAMMNNVIEDCFPIWLLPNVSRTDNPDADWYTGYRVDSGDVRGLGEVPKERKPREGQLVLKDITGAPHAVRIVAHHKYPIPDDSYTLMVPTHTQIDPWVVGWLREDGKFEKVSVVRIAPDEYLDIKKYGLQGKVRTELC